MGLGKGAAGAGDPGLSVFLVLKGKDPSLLGMHREDSFSVSEILCKKNPKHLLMLKSWDCSPVCLSWQHAELPAASSGGEQSPPRGCKRFLSPAASSRCRRSRWDGACPCAGLLLHPGYRGEGCSGGRCPRLAPRLRSETRRRSKCACVSQHLEPMGAW